MSIGAGLCDLYELVNTIPPWSLDIRLCAICYTIYTTDLPAFNITSRIPYYRMSAAETDKDFDIKRSGVPEYVHVR